jgi:hypothetical protein
MLLCCCSRASRARRSVLPVSPNSFSNTARGLYSMNSGCVGLRHEIVCVYAQLRLPVQAPALAAASIESSSEPSCVSLANCLASIWSIETSAMTSTSLRPPRVVPVRNDPEAPAWM